MRGEPEEVQLARATLERKTGPESHPTAQALARAVIAWWESSEIWRKRVAVLLKNEPRAVDHTGLECMECNKPISDDTCSCIEPRFPS